MKKITSYLLRFWKTNSRPLLKKNTYLFQKKEVLIEKLKTVLPAVILKKKSRPPTSQNFKTHKTFVVQWFLSYKYTSKHKIYTSDIYVYVCKKNHCTTEVLWVFKFWEVEGPEFFFKITRGRTVFNFSC